jgi:hypothetical protein
MGRFTVRLPDTLHSELQSRAHLEGVSLNQYIVYALTRQVSSGSVVQIISDEQVQGQQERFNKLLNNLGRPSRTETRQILAERERVEPENGLSQKLIDQVQQMIAQRLAANPE